MNAKTNSASHRCPASSFCLLTVTMKANSTNPICVHLQKDTHTHTHTHTEAGGQNKVVTPEEEIRMTKENGTESGEL